MKSYKLDTIIKVVENLSIGCGSYIRPSPGASIDKKEFPSPPV